MKQIHFYLCLLTFMVAAFSCKKTEDEQQAKSDVQFSFEMAGTKSQLKSAKADTVANAAAVIVTVEDLTGKVLYNTERIELYNMSGYYISKPISLVPGGYKLTSFMVVDKDGNVLYVTPKEGSKLAYLVNDPLPISFSVLKDKVTKVVPQVISAKNSKPQDFGYATFSFDVVKTFDFLIGVFVYNETIQNFEMTTAHLSIITDSSSYQKDIPAVTDTITLKDGSSKYILTVSKDGYKTWVDTLSASELKLYFRSEDKGPLKVILTEQNVKKIFFTTNQDTLSQINGRIDPFPNTKLELQVNWGDGTSENYKGLNSFILNHRYIKEGVYFITISGSVESIMDLELIACRVTSLDVKMAKNLTLITVAKNYNLKLLDLSNLHRLGAIACSFTSVDSLNINNSENLMILQCRNSKIKRIDLSQKFFLTSIDLSYNLLDMEDVNKLFEDLLLSVKSRPRSGAIFLSPTPTGNGQVAMEELVSKYGWSFKNVSY